MQEADSPYAIPTSASDAVYYVALSMIPLVGGVMARQLISYCGSAEAVFSASRRQIADIPGIGPKTRAQLSLRQKWLEVAEREIACCREKGIQVITLSSSHYPERLRQIYDAPVVLFYRGDAVLDAPRVIGIVGTRRATDYGRRVTEELVGALAAHNALIVSGLAYGIDIAAHRAALRAGIPTVGVMASGLDTIYPAVHRSDALAMVEQGGLLTEGPLGTRPDGPRFPARNRIIAGLSDAVIVVEAAEKGGALITANLANDYDREVFAVPGNLYHKHAQGCHRLIKEHKARLLTDSQDVVEILNWDIETRSSRQAAVNSDIDVRSLSQEERAIVILLEAQPEGMVLDEISWKSEIPVNQLAAVLLSLEFKQVVKALPGRKFQRK